MGRSLFFIVHFWRILPYGKGKAAVTQLEEQRTFKYQFPMGKVKRSLHRLGEDGQKVSIPYGKGKVAAIPTPHGRLIDAYQFPMGKVKMKMESGR